MMDDKTPRDVTLDPDDWQAVRDQGHRMLDDMFDYLEHRRSRPVWQPIPDAVRAEFRAPLPRTPSELKTVYQDFKDLVVPYATGNTHPSFFGWVHGGGSAVGMLAEMLAGGLNANLGGRDHMPIEVERQVVSWVRQMFGFPPEASGLFVTGTSMANLVAVWVARRRALGKQVRAKGLGEEGAKLRAYTSRAAHGSIARAFNLAGLGTDALRLIPTDNDHRIMLDALAESIAADQAAGLRPFAVIGTAGTVDTGAIDDLAGLAAVCKAHDLWFHVDGAFGALGILSPTIAPRLKGIEQAHSIALDFHKWGQVPYDAGFVLVRDGAIHRATFAAPAPYLRRAQRGLAAGSPWPSDLGPDLSRGFRALKTWLTLKVYGADRLGAVMEHTCELARYLAGRIEAEPRLELMAPVALNIVCFRYRATDSDRVNADIVGDLHESGLAAPSTTVLESRLCIRAAFVNHRTQSADVDNLVDAVLSLGAAATSRCRV